MPHLPKPAIEALDLSDDYHIAYPATAAVMGASVTGNAIHDLLYDKWVSDIICLGRIGAGAVVAIPALVVLGRRGRQWWHDQNQIEQNLFLEERGRPMTGGSA